MKRCGVCHPRAPIAWLPAVKRGSFDATTSPTVSPVIASPIATGAAYDFRVDMRPRM